MKRFMAVAVLCAAALCLIAGSASAVGYKYIEVPVYWGAAESTYCYIPAGASVAVKNSSVIGLPNNFYWPAVSDSQPLVIVSATISAAGAATDTLMLGLQWTVDGSNFIPALDWDIDDQVHVGTGLYFTYRFLRSSGAAIADAAAGAGRYAAGVPNTYAWGTVPVGAKGFRLVVHPSNAARTLNGKLTARVRVPVANEY